MSRVSISHPNLLTPGEYKLVLRNCFASFTTASFYELNPHTRFIPGAHIELILQALEKCRRGETRRLIINVPPRSLKSHCASVAFPAWVLGHNPSTRIICASYGQELADKLARDTRQIISARWYKALFNTRLAERQAVHDFETTENGGRLATSVGGSLTGRGGDIVILDDPAKPDEALSETQRNNANEWFFHTLNSRLNNKKDGCIIIVMQRLHQDDLVGRVLETDDWEILSFPAIQTEDRTHLIEGPLGRRKVTWKAGEALHPERDPLNSLMRIKRTMGEYHFSAQYQQAPLPPGGAIVKLDWLKYYEPGSEPGRFSRLVQSWDTANKAGELNDFSVCTTWGVDKSNYYLLHVSRKRLTFPDLVRSMLELRKQWRPTQILIEDKVSGIQLIQEAKRLGVNVTPYQPAARADKETRLHAQTSPFENGRVFLRKDAGWLQDYVNELTGFPGTKHDDQVDSTTQFLDYIGSRPGPMIISEEALRRSAIPGPYALKRMGLMHNPIQRFF